MSFLPPAVVCLLKNVLQKRKGGGGGGGHGHSRMAWISLKAGRDQLPMTTWAKKVTFYNQDEPSGRG